MMFWLTASLLLALAAAFSLRPFLRRRSKESADREGENVRIYRERLAELRSEHDEGRVGDEDVVQLEAELKHSLLGDAAAEEGAQGTAESGRWLGFVVVALVIVGSLAFYMAQGDLEGLNIADEFHQLQARSFEDPDQVAQAKALTRKLLTRVHSQSGNADMWYLLGRSALYAQEYRLSAGALRQVLELGGDEPVVRIYLVQALYLANDRAITPEVRAEIDQVLARQPNEPIMVEMLAATAFKRGDYAEAAKWFQRGLGQRLEPARERYFQQGLVMAKAKLGDAPAAAPEAVAEAAQPGFQVEVEASAELRRSLPPSTVVFILARAPGERMPLAVARRQLGELPTTVVLDDSTAMNPARPLSTAEAVEIVARTSTSGDVSRSADDVETVGGPFRMESGVTPVKLLLQADAASASGASQPGFQVQVDVAPAIRDELPPSTLVFILARAPGERMPLAVARRQLGELPTTVVLDDSTAMNPARRLSTAEAVEIVARTSTGGTASRSADDVEAVAGPFRLESGMTPVNLLLQSASSL